MQGSHFYIGDLYPNLYPGTTRKATIPEADEQKHYDGTGEAAPVAVAPSSRVNVWLGIIIMLGVLYLLNA